MILPVFPWVSLLVGTGYISAVSNILMPYVSKAISNWAWASSSVFCWPHVIVPKVIFDIINDDEPSFTLGITSDDDDRIIRQHNTTIIIIFIIFETDYNIDNIDNIDNEIDKLSASWCND